MYASMYITSDFVIAFQKYHIMKRLTHLLAMVACSVSFVQAAELYDITLSNAKRYTQCRIIYEAGGNTKFSGLDRKGNPVTMEVKSSSILDKREAAPKPVVTPQPSPTPAPETPTPATTDATATDTPPADTPAADAAAPATESAEEPGTPAENAAPVVNEEDAAKVKDVSLRLREKLAQADAEYASLSKPSRSLQNLCQGRKQLLNNKLADLDKLAIEVAELQTNYNNVKGADYVYKHISTDDRNKYERDGKAAYQAMLTDVKQYKNARKVGGLDKFEILRDKYQGIPEYKEAYKWYIATLNDLSRRWENLLKRETSRRSKLNSAKKSDMDERDRIDYDKLEQQFEKNGEQIAQVWYNPDNRNLVMLRAATNKVRDALRRNENGLKDESIGTVPALITQYWEANEKARQLMINGDYEGAENLLKEDEAYKTLLRLKIQLLPEEYKSPLRAQRQDLEQTIRTRSRERRQLKSQLERKISALENAASSAEAQINVMLEKIAQEKEVDTQATSIELDEKKPAPAAKDAKQAAPAETAAKK